MTTPKNKKILSIVFFLILGIFVLVSYKAEASDVYTLLAPIGNLTTAPDNIGEYFNIMVEIAIGLCAVLAVIMIVIGGIQYMGDESIFGKTEAKGKIIQSIFGLLIALGAFALLNTIDPALLGQKGIDIKSVSGEVLDYANSIYIKTSAADSARCKVLTSGPCSVANLRGVFGDKAEAMSKICNVESGGVASKQSSYDKDINGKVFSFGLFQINMIMNGDKFTGTSSTTALCTDLFVKADGSKIVGNNYIKKVNGKYVYDAKLALPLYYESCRNTLLDSTKNIAIAKKAFDERGLLPWKYSDGQICPSAFE